MHTGEGKTDWSSKFCKLSIFSTCRGQIQQDKYKARHAHQRLYMVLPKYSKIQVLPSITSCRLMKYNKQAIELNDLLEK